MSIEKQLHWKAVYESKKAEEVSWYQPEARLSLDLIRGVASGPTESIIDVGSGASTLVDGLLAAGYCDVTVLDIASAATEVSVNRLREKSKLVKWMTADILDADLPRAGYGVWHDRAVFHFLTNEADRRRYVKKVNDSVRPGGFVLVATFAGDGPAKCSGLPVMRYEPEALHKEFGPDFSLIESRRESHNTPMGTQQSFIYCLCRTSG